MRNVNGKGRKDLALKSVFRHCATKQNVRDKPVFKTQLQLKGA